MKFHSSFIIFFFSLGVAQSKLHLDSLYISGKLLIEKTNGKPYSGLAYDQSSLSGKKIKEINTLNGELHGTYTEWWGNGNKKLYGRYRFGEKNGRWLDYYKNGNISSETNYKNGIKNGISNNYYENGKRSSRGMYKEGKKDRGWSYWNEDGDLIDYICIKTMFGVIKAILFNNKAAMHTKSFKKHVRKGYYNGTTFHRVIPGFVIQGGDPNTISSNRKIHGMGGAASEYFGIGNKKDPTTWKIPSEFNNIPHKRGILSMARGYKQDSAGSQFFICVQDAPNLDNRYTVFGKIIEGMEIVDEIVNVPVDTKDNPIDRIEMEIYNCN